jgi:hypothetical protein
VWDAGLAMMTNWFGQPEPKYNKQQHTQIYDTNQVTANTYITPTPCAQQRKKKPNSLFSISFGLA